MNIKDIIKTASLIVIDVQNDFCPGGSLAIQDGDKIVDTINRIAPSFRYTAATKDWHPAGHISFASSHPGKKPFDTALAGSITQTVWPDHCVQGTSGAEFHPRLSTHAFSVILHKGRNPQLDSYSAFFENDRITPTGLEFLLRGQKIHQVFLCGLATDVCVFYTAQDAVRLGFDTYLVEDASKGVTEESTQKALLDLKAAGVITVASKEML